MDFRILGPLEVRASGELLPLGGPRQRALLAVLLLNANRVVGREALIEQLGPRGSTELAGHTLTNQASRLRKALEADERRLVTRAGGYELRVAPGELDLERFETALATGRAELRNGELERAVATLRRAECLWRGPPLADVELQQPARAEGARLADLQADAIEERIEAELGLGRHGEMAAELRTLVAQHPLRERLRRLLMLALYGSGRQAEALEAYRDARRALVDQLGIEPGAQLRGLHEAMLRQDPELEPAAAGLPRQLDPSAASPLVGREAELSRLRACWRRPAGALVTVVGTPGMGKTRIAAELAGEARNDGATVLYAAGRGPPAAALAALARARGAGRALLVLDDADHAGADVRAAVRRLARDGLLVLATALDALPWLEPDEALVLAPLGADSVRVIAGGYGPVDAAPVEALLAISHGVARRVHEAASDWALGAATRRIDVAAARATAGRRAIRVVEAELAGGIVDLQRARQAGNGGSPVACPYKGLATFAFEDAEYYFGRERLVAESVARLAGARLLAVVGPSGSGKSSLVRAGLLPALASGALPGSERWSQALIRPGVHPLRELGEVAGVLAVDQFEELFTACADERERSEFIAALLRAPGLVIVALRADFYGRCAAYAELARALGENQVLVGRMSRGELRRAIEQPARRAGLVVEPELADVLLDDVEDRPGGLPLLSTALFELWRERDGRELRLAAYARSGGVQRAVARLAENAYLELAPDEQEAARGLLLRLAGEDEGGALVRRRIALAELEPFGGVVDALTARRLLTVSAGTVEVAHEALLREWPRLRAWLDEDAQGRRLHTALAAAAHAWSADGRDPGALYRGARLASALDWAAGHEPELDVTERAFLAAGRDASARAQRRLRMVLTGVASLLVLALIAGTIALHERGTARAAATTAAAQELGAQALAEDELDRALLLARQGMALRDSTQTRGNLLSVLLKSPAAIGMLRGDGSPLTSLALSPDGRTLVFSDAHARLRFVDVRTRRAAAPSLVVAGLSPQAGPTAASSGSFGDYLRFSDDGALLAVGGDDPVVVDARTHRTLAHVPRYTIAYGLGFSPGGRTLFAVFGGPAAGSTAVRRFDWRTGSLSERYLTRRPDVVSLMVAHDGRLLTSFASGGTAIRDPRTLRPLRRLPTGAERAALSPDDRTLLAGGRDGSVRFLDLVTGAVRTASGRHEGAVVQAAFSPDGRTAVTAGADNRLIVWDVARARAVDTLTGHAGHVTGLAISPDGRTLYSSSLDGRILIWDLGGERRLGRPFAIGPGNPTDIPHASPSWPLLNHPLLSYALRSDGRVLAVGQGDGTVTLTDTRTLQPLARLRAVPHGPVRGIGYVPGTPVLAVAGDNGFLALVDARSDTPTRRLHGHSGTVLTPSFSADGRLMASVGAGDRVLLWRLAAGRPIGRPRSYAQSTGPSGPTDVSISPDGRRLAITSPLGVEIVDVATLRRITWLPGAETVKSLAHFSPDGRFVVAGSTEGWARLWSTRTWRPATRTLTGGTAEVLWESVSPDGHTLATGSADGTIRLFDLRTQQPLGRALPGLPDRPVGPQFTPDGTYLLAITNAGRAYRWDVRASSWAQDACAIAGRVLSRAEWADALPGRAYAPACTR